MELSVSLHDHLMSLRPGKLTPAEWAQIIAAIAAVIAQVLGGK